MVYDESMEHAYMYAVIELVIGLGLLFFGLRLIKISVAIFGFLFGYMITMMLLSDFDITPLLMLGGVAVGVLCAAIAFRFYAFATSLVIAFFAGNLAYAAASYYDLDAVWTALLTGGSGLLVFAVARALKIVEAVFAFATSVQGASAVIAAIYIFLYPGRLEFMQQHSVSVLLGASGMWLILWAVVAAGGFISQLRYIHKPSEDE